MKIPRNLNILGEDYEIPIKYRVFRYLNSSEVQEGYISYLPKTQKWLDCRRKKSLEDGDELLVELFIGTDIVEDVGGPKIKNLEFNAFYVFEPDYVRRLNSYDGLVRKNSRVTILSDGKKRHSSGVPGVLALWDLIKEDIKAWEKSEQSPLVEFESRLKVAVDAALNATPGIDTKCLPAEFYANLLEELMQL